MEYEADKFEHAGFTVRIIQDPDCEDPRTSNDGFITKYVMSHRRYDLPNDAGIDFDDFGGWEEIRQHLENECGAIITRKVYMIDHSGIAFSLLDFNDPWDSGVVGVAYITEADWNEVHQGVTNIPVDEHRLYANMKAELEEYSQWSNGECYGFVIEDGEGMEETSCWGFIGTEYCTEEAKREGEAIRDMRLRMVKRVLEVMGT